MGLILLSPVFIVTAILVYIKLGSPIFFVQERVGKDNKVFKMIKFRSMKFKLMKKLKETKYN